MFVDGFSAHFPVVVLPETLFNDLYHSPPPWKCVSTILADIN